jgi:hypothetical protein
VSWNPAINHPPESGIYCVWMDDGYDTQFASMYHWVDDCWKDPSTGLEPKCFVITHWMKIEPPTL